MKSKKQLLLIDGSSYIYRAFHAIPYLSNSNGLPTNAIYGFTQMLLKVIKDFKPDHIAVAFDVKGPSFRHKMYEEYKAHRPEMPDSLKPQIPYIKELVKAFHIPVLELEGFEADDIIGTLSKHMKEKGIEVVIVAADKDMLQLVDNNTTIVDTLKDKKLGIQEVRERFGIGPEHITDMMGLAGDAADNIPGVKGIGEKTAIKLIKQFGTLEEVLHNRDKIADKKIKESLTKHAEEAQLSKRLATIDADVPVDYRFEDLAAAPPDYEKLKELFKELEFIRLLKEIIPGERPPQSNYHLITNGEGLEGLVKEIEKIGEIAIVIKMDKPISGSIFGLALCMKPHEAFYIPVRHSSGQQTPEPRLPDTDSGLQSPGFNLQPCLEAMKPVIENTAIQKIAHDIKGVHLFFKQHDIQMKGAYFDTSIGSYLLNPSRPSHDIEDMAHEMLGYKIESPKDLSFEELSMDDARARACAEADAIFQLSKRFLPELENAGLLKLFHEIEIPLTEVLSDMELAGIKVDNDYLFNFSKELETEIDNIKRRIYSIAGIEFNINSPKQLSEVLFERLQLKPVKRTKTGYSTDEEVLRALALGHELPHEILNFRQLSKLKSTYVDALLGLINPVTRRVHTSFNQTVTATGRLSSSEPNLQNIPIRTELGKRIRQAFVADKGCLFLSADYSQIELRIVAHLSRDPLLMEAFKKDEDIHTRTASEVFGVAPELVTEEMRRRAKAINFGIIYGMGPYGLSAELGISQDEAKGYIDNYFLHYKEVKIFIDTTIDEAREKGYVTTLFGRRRYVPELRSESEQVRRFGERIAINTSVQGTAADLIKIAMIHVYKRLREDNLRSKMLLQIHDELIFEAHQEEIEPLKGIVKREMETAAHLSVPIKVDIHVGKNWKELE